MLASINADCELTVSIVTYFPDFPEFNRTLKSLKVAIDDLHQKHSVHVRVVIVDNSVNEYVATKIAEIIRHHLEKNTELICLPTNTGYGVGHNLAIKDSSSEWYLVMNSDIELDVDALSAAYAFLNHPENQIIGLVSPHCITGDGHCAYLCKRYPSVFDLALRGFAPGRLKKKFERRLAYYEYRNETNLKSVQLVTIASGCFMFLRGEIWRQIGGFSPDYFLYFEDFDLCMRLDRISKIAYVPEIRIVHHGGHAAKKGIGHVFMFARSAYRFFSTYGWQLS